MLRTTWVARGKEVEREVPAWPTYVFAAWARGEGAAAAWHVARDLVGVLGILGDGDPTPVPAEVVDAYRDPVMLETVAGLSADWRRGFDVGDAVRFTHSGFVDAAGTCSRVTGPVTQVKTVLLGRPIVLLVPTLACSLDPDIRGNTKNGVGGERGVNHPVRRGAKLSRARS